MIAGVFLEEIFHTCCPRRRDPVPNGLGVDAARRWTPAWECHVRVSVLGNCRSTNDDPRPGSGLADLEEENITSQRIREEQRHS